MPIATLAAARAGNTVRLSFVVPQKTTDKLPVRGEFTAKLCRSAGEGSCQPAGSVAVKPLESVTLEDALPAALASGPPRLLAYQVTLENSGGKSAAASAVAYAVAGQAPAPVAAFTAAPRRDGIVLHWLPATPEQHADQSVGENAPHGGITSVRFAGLRTAGRPPTAPKPSVMPGAAATPAEQDDPPQQTLQVPEGSATDRPPAALDATARTGRSYRYSAQRLARYTLAGHALEMASTPSAPVLVDYRDVFPPPPPTGLVSAVDTPGRAIDLTWTPDQDPHLSGYVVYRRAVGRSGSDGMPQRLTPPGKPVTVTAWRDTTAVAGQRYAYSVSAVDPSGNESPRSTEVEDTLPAPDAQP